MADQAAGLEQLRRSFGGQCIGPRDAGYEVARTVWNGMIDLRPALIARPSREDDVSLAVNIARENGVLLAVRGGGHNVAGFGTCDGGLVLDMTGMKGMRVDAAARTAEAQAGLTWGEFDAATQAHGLATTGGLVSTTGIAGFTLGGGFGWLVRKYGLTVDNLLGVEMVLADGSQVRANAEENPDLFWGVRGGGGNFGVVTKFLYRLHPVGPQIFGGAVFHPAARAKDLLRFYQGWTRQVPDELSTMVVFLTAPPAPFVPEKLVGTPMIAVALCYAGDPGEGERVIRPLREFAPAAIDLAGPMPYVALQGMFDATAPRGIHSYWKTQYLRDLNDAAIDTLVEHAGRLSGLAPFSTVHIHHWEGAAARAKGGETAFAHRGARYVLNVIGMWMAGEDANKHIQWVRGLFDATQAMGTGQAYLNFMGEEGAARVQSAYDAETWERLRQLKRKYDPGNLFRVNQNIPPAE
jgi:FAD/FMN-containing dehydrogenase